MPAQQRRLRPRSQPRDQHRERRRVLPPQSRHRIDEQRPTIDARLPARAAGHRDPRPQAAGERRLAPALVPGLSRLQHRSVQPLLSVHPPVPEEPPLEALPDDRLRPQGRRRRRLGVGRLLAAAALRLREDRPAGRGLLLVDRGRGLLPASASGRATSRLFPRGVRAPSDRRQLHHARQPVDH